MGSTPTTAGWRRLLHPFRSVRVRITLAAVLVTAVAVGTAGLLLVRSVEGSQIHRVRADIDRDLDLVATRLREGMPIEEAVSVQPSSRFVFLRITDGNTMVATFATGPEGTLFPTPPPGLDAGSAVAHGSVERTETDRAPEGGEVRGEVRTETSAGPGGPRDTAAATDPVEGGVGGATPGTGGPVIGSYETITRTVETRDGEMTVTAAVPVDQLAGTVSTLRRGLAIGLPALIAVVAALAWVLVGRALRPVEAVRAEVDAITGSTMHRRVPVPPTGDEIGRLARTMNAMLGRLDAAATRQHQFVSDASHELRSPVAALRTCLEVARRNPDRADWAAVADTALAEEARLEALLDDLLLLAAHDEDPGACPPVAVVDLAALADTEAGRPRRVPVAVTAAPAAPVRQVDGDGDGDADPPLVRGNADRLSRAIGNVVDNAAHYATGTVCIAVGRRDDALRVTVDDDGPGVPPADRERIFERFTRLDHGRARPEGGTGLGLAVVRSIVADHDGRVWADDSPLGGARIVIELPARQGPSGSPGAAGPRRR